MTRARFISPATALNEAECAALKAGAHPAAYRAHCMIRTAREQGAILGYEAWYRSRHGEPMQPVMEH